jgi:lysophospholipid acyltransferase (LPLAT)-like uncharacterized protein
VKKLRIRDLLLKYPLLDKARVHGFAAFFRYGLFFYDTTYRRLAVIPEAAKPYVATAGTWRSKPGALNSLKPAVYAYFHGHMHVLLGLTPRERMTLIVSNSRDGEMIARAAEDMGYQVARGSRTEGGVKGALKLLGAANSDRSILFPVDGPRGPKEVVKPEVIRIAQLAGLPIIPVIAIARTMDKMKSWDNYNCPFTNSLMVYIYGAPMSVQAIEGVDRNYAEAGSGREGGDQVESFRQELETYMLALKARADCFFEKDVYGDYLD